MDKKELRSAQIKYRKNMPPEIKEEELKVQEICYEHVVAEGYRKVLVYVSTPEELCTLQLIESLLAGGIEVYVPKVSGKEMFFYRINSLDDLKPGYMKILEPKDTCERLDDSDGVPLIIFAPGLAFDKHGYRLGYGGGYYDRYLKSCIDKKIEYKCLGLAFSPFLWTKDMIPSEVTDICIDGVVTSLGIIRSI